jgi:hypothetical protein
MPVSDAGVVLLKAAEEDEGVAEFMGDILATVGGAEHPSGEPGVGVAQLDRFLAEAKARLDWEAKGEMPEGEAATDVMPFGPETPELHGLLSEVRSKIDEYFAQCSVVALDRNLAGRLPPLEGELEETNFGDPDAIEGFMKNAPLAPPNAEWVLDIEGPVNPYYAQRVRALRDRLLSRMLEDGLKRLRQTDWRRVKDRFDAYEAWRAAKPETPVENLGMDRLGKYLEGPYAEKVRKLIDRRKETTLQLDNIRLAEKLVLFQACLLDFANNFVSFPHLYDPGSRAMFEMGTLIMDGRRFNMAVGVQSRAEHEAVAKTSDIFVLYIEVAGESGKKPYEVAVPVTSGGRGNLVAGKRGIFQDIEGREWDARVVQIIQNPISLGEAIVAPFKRIGGLITGKIEQLTSAAEKKLDVTTQETLSQVGTVEQSGAPQPAPQPQTASNRGLMAGGLLAGGGVAIAAVSSALAYISSVVAKHNFWILAGIGGAVLAVLLPSVILAFIKLRSRDLSAILEGSGWAINARMRLTQRQSRYFTMSPPYPRGAKGFAILRKWIAWILVLAVIAALVWGVIYLAGRQSGDEGAIHNENFSEEQDIAPGNIGGATSPGVTQPSAPE